MKKRTSKSASERRQTSSRFGTYGQTDDMASKSKKRKRVSRYEELVTRVRSMSSDEFRKSLVAAGITNADGTLAKKYKA